MPSIYASGHGTKQFAGFPGEVTLTPQLTPDTVTLATGITVDNLLKGLVKVTSTGTPDTIALPTATQMTAAYALLNMQVDSSFDVCFVNTDATGATSFKFSGTGWTFVGNGTKVLSAQMRIVKNSNTSYTAYLI